MGLRGTQSAREVAAIVLMDDNFATIVQAIAEGRQLFANLSRSFAFLLIVHIPLVTTAAAIPLLDFPLLYLPIHIILLELFIHPAAILGFQQKPGPTIAKNAPRRKGFFDRRQIAAICVTGFAVAFSIGWQFIVSLTDGANTGHARTLAFFVLLAAMSVALAILGGLKDYSSRAVICAAFGFLLAIACVPGVAAWFDFTTVGLKAGLIATGLGISAALPGLALMRASERG